MVNKPTGTTHHAIDYIEINVTDLAASKAFYAAAFGWAFTDYGPGYSGIVAATDGATTKEQGGLALADAVTPGGSLIILYSDALEESLDAVKGAGGAISKPIFSFPGGRRFHFTDPSGNELGVWTHT